ncbi:cytochrome c oxidase subunit II [Bradyrhizobium australiense]|uniref:Cytochrome aa3 subunit 2 n=1 Tax=Bradyrhizobium australiense TaxID=2721161 RepID=A0A7Y4GMP6_9BRAD|nr:cytochrome c oxidase subunit II [Bradyrhizobium australiense]NOJ38422.1 cytochrome c oxidase subunit II [Bradyrhizobium australiense]
MTSWLRLSLAIAGACVLASCTGWQSSFNAQAPQADEIRRLLLIFIAVSAVVWIGVMVVLFFGMLRRKRQNQQPLDLHEGFERRAGSVVLIAGLLTTVTVLALSFVSYGAQRTVFANEADPVTIKVTGHQWWWEVQYQADSPHLSFTTANEIRVPVGKPVTVELESADVIHSFWVPSLTGKMDLITGQRNSLQFTARTAGIYRGQCAEFCGIQHAHMAFTVRALPPDEYSRWRHHQNQGAASPGDPLGIRGEQLFRGRGCGLCHTIRGTLAGGQFGPDLTHVASRDTIAAGTLPKTSGNLAAWISDPQHIKPGNLMPKMALQSDEMIAIVHYLEQLQ